MCEVEGKIASMGQRDAPHKDERKGNKLMDGDTRTIESDCYCREKNCDFDRECTIVVMLLWWCIEQDEYIQRLM